VANPVQWGVDQLFAFLSQIQTGADGERAQLSMNNAGLIDLNAQADAIADPPTRSAFKSWISTSVNRQYTIAGVYRDLSARFASLAAQVKAWLVSVGISPSSSGLNGLGIAPALIVVPLALVALAAAAWAAVQWMREANRAQVDAIAFHRQALADLVAKGASADQLAAFAKQADATVAKQMPTGDPFGDLMSQVGSLLGIAAAVVLGVYVYKQVRQSRRAAAA
jgi:hypothetical protein